MSTDTIPMEPAAGAAAPDPDRAAVVEALVHYASAAAAIVFPRGGVDVAELQKIEKLKAAIARFDPSYRRGVVEIIQIIDPNHIDLSYALNTNTSGVFFAPLPFICAVPVSNPNSHNYPIGEPALLVQHGGGISGLRLDQTPGNTPPGSPACFRAPTLDEARTFFTRYVDGLAVARPTRSGGWAADMAAFFNPASETASADDAAAAAA